MDSMPSSLYDRFKVGARASHAELIRAYQREVSDLVSRIDAARQHGADYAPLEHQKRELQEAKSILLDPHRRRRYDAYLARMHSGRWPNNATELWQDQRSDIVDPRIVAALEFMASTTHFELGTLLDEQPSPENQTQPMISIEPTERTPTPHSGQELRPAEAPAGIDEDSDFEGTEMVSVQPQRVARASIPANTPPAQQLSTNALIKKYGFTGRFLKAIREQKGQSIDELSELTQITKEMLSALEQHQFDRLPAMPYVKGWLNQLEEELELDNIQFAEKFYAMLVRRRQRPS